ncbi:MAG: membrane protein insertion efficiency factor YidD [Acidobacteriota bacterium]
MSQLRRMTGSARPSGNNPLRNPATWLALLVLLAALAVADSFRPPSHQVTVRLFTAAVAGYHHGLHPLTGRFIRCRYRPTCSRYAVEAVQKYGIAKGLALACRRILSCRGSVPMGTRDPVP